MGEAFLGLLILMIPILLIAWYFGPHEDKKWESKAKSAREEVESARLEEERRKQLEFQRQHKKREEYIRDIREKASSLKDSEIIKEISKIILAESSGYVSALKEAMIKGNRDYFPSCCIWVYNDGIMITRSYKNYNGSWDEYYRSEQKTTFSSLGYKDLIDETERDVFTVALAEIPGIKLDIENGHIRRVSYDTEYWRPLVEREILEEREAHKKNEEIRQASLKGIF